MSATPRPESFLSGRVGYVGPRRAVALRAADRVLDAGLRVRGTGPRLDRVAAAIPARRVLALCIYRAGAARAAQVAAGLSSERHEVTRAFGSLGPPATGLADVTVSPDLDGGKFENLNAVLESSGRRPDEFDWTLVLDDDILLPERFLDRFLAVCEALRFDIAQPAQTLASHAAWQVTRRRPLALARRTGYVEIGPAVAFRRSAAQALIPFPPLRFGWGLDLHWAAVAAERGWRLGVVDAVPVRHDESGVASAYRHADAVAEATGFLADHPYVESREANRTLAAFRRLPAPA